MTSKTAIYPGTFDPITFGHMDVIIRGLKIVDKLVIGVAANITKQPVFSLEKRVGMIVSDIKSEGVSNRVEVIPFDGLLVDFAKEQKACMIIRGLRAVSDYEYEIQLASTNSKLNPDIQTVFLPASESKQFIASNLVKEVARLGGDVSHFVSSNVQEELNKNRS